MDGKNVNKARIIKFQNFTKVEDFEKERTAEDKEKSQKVETIQLTEEQLRYAREAAEVKELRKRHKNLTQDERRELYRAKFGDW